MVGVESQVPVPRCVPRVSGMVDALTGSELFDQMEGR
jgi:hypothetical protein